jgi:hypothetical protein
MSGRPSASWVGVWAGLLGAGACGVGGAVVGPIAAADAAPAACAPLAIRDPGFTTPGAWTTTGSAQVSFGTAVFDMDTRCDFGGIAETVPSPAIACAWPRVLDLQTTFAFADPSEQGSLGVRVNGGWNLVEPQLGTTTTRVCLGPRAFGGAADLFIGAGAPPLDCGHPDTTPSIELGGVTVGPDATDACPPFDTVGNGDFEAGPTGWTLVPDEATAEIVPGAGDGGSLGARLATTHVCSNPRIRGVLSLPLAATTPNPALRIWSNGSPGVTMSVLVGAARGQQTYLRGVGAPRVETICVPGWAEGTVQPLSFALVDNDGDCDDPSMRSFAFDDLAFVSDATCAADVGVRDGSFEQAGAAASASGSAASTASAWVLQPNLQGTGGDVALRVDPSYAHTGQVAAVFTADGPCAAAGLEGSVTVPTPTAAAGPALSFWYRTNAFAHAGVVVSLTSLFAPLAFRPTGAWTRVTACLDPAQAGRPDQLNIVLRGGGGECVDTYDAVDTFAVDDVALGTDAACPTR